MTAAEVRRFDLFAGLSQDDAAALGRQVARQHIPRGAALFRQGEPATHLVLLPEGQVKMERVSPDGVGAIVEVLGAGSVLAAGNFLGQKPYPLTATALVDLTCGTLHYGDFAACVRAHPDVALALLRYLGLRLQRAYAARRTVGRSPVRIAADAAKDAQGHAVIRLSHADLADVAGTARETVTRHLRRWQEQGILALGVRTIRVLDLAALTRLAVEG